MAKTYSTLALLKSGFRTDYSDIDQTNDYMDDWIQVTAEMIDPNIKQVAKQYAFLLDTANGLTVSEKVHCLVKKDLHYDTGLVSLSYNSKIVTGTGTNWVTAGIQADDWLIPKGRNKGFRVHSVDSATQITLKDPYDATNPVGGGESTSSVWYSIVRDGTITVITNPFERKAESWRTDDTRNFSQKILTTFTKNLNRAGDFIGLAAGDTYYALGIEVIRAEDISECATVIVTWAKSTDTDVETQIQKYHSVVAKTAGGSLKLSQADGVDGVVVIK